MPILRCDNVVKSYPSKGAKKPGFALTVEQLLIDAPGIYLLLGPNGSGKTTFIKLILHLLIAEAGQIELFDLSYTDPKARTWVGYVPEEFSFPSDLRFKEALVLFGTLNRPGSPSLANLDEIITALHIGSLLGKKVRQLSKGELQLLALSHALLGDKRFLVCDEPLSGLDPKQKDRAMEYLTLLKNTRGVTVLFSTHVLSEAEEIYTSVIPSAAGRIGPSLQRTEVKSKFGSLRRFFYREAELIDEHPQPTSPDI